MNSQGRTPNPTKIYEVKQRPNSAKRCLQTVICEQKYKPHKTYAKAVVVVCDVNCKERVKSACNLGEKSMPKLAEVNLYSMRNELDLLYRRVDSIIRDKKADHNQVSNCAADMVQRLYDRKILRRDDALKIKFDDQLTPKRSCSANPRRKDSPDTSANRYKSQTRFSRRDSYEHGGAKVTLQVNNVEDEKHPYKPKRPDDLVSQKLYVENVELKKAVNDLEKKLNQLEDSVQRMRYFEDNLQDSKLENIDMRKKLDGVSQKCRKLEKKNSELLQLNALISQQAEAHFKASRGTQDDILYKVQAEQYQNERNMARYENHKLKEDLEKLKRMETDENKNVLLNYDNVKLRKQNQDFWADIGILKENLQKLEMKLATSEANIDFMEEERTALKNTIANQKMQILEIQTRADENTRDANIAISKYTDEEIRYKKSSSEAKAEIVNMQMDKEELQSMLQKQRKISIDEKQNSEKLINTMEKKIKELEKEKKRGVENTETLNKRIAECEKQQKEVVELQREQDDIKREGKSNLKLKNENNSLREEIFEMENKHATEIREHINVVRQYKNKIVHYKEEKDRANKKVDNLQHDLKDASDRLKEQEAISNRQMAVHEANIRDLQKQLSETESTRYMTEDYQKEELVNKNEEIAKLTRKLYSMEEELELCSKTKRLLEVKNEDLEIKLKEAVNQHFSLEGRLSSTNFKRLSDIEKENVSLKEELSVTLNCLNKERQEFKNLENRLEEDDRKMTDVIKNLKSEKDILEIDNTTLKGQIEKLQEQWNRFKSQENMKHDFSRKETSSLNEQKLQLEQDKRLLREKIYTLEKQNEKLNERMKNTESDTKKVQQYQTENERLKKLYASLKSDFTTLEAKLEAESTIRLNKDKTLENLKEENNRLKKERNTAKTELQTATREREKLSEALQTEKYSGKAELNNLKTEKAELIAVFKEKSNKDKEKMDKLERENKNLHSTCSRFTSDEKANQNNAYEFMQLKNDNEICKKQKLQLEEDLSDVNHDCEDLERKLKETENHNRKISEEYEGKLKQLKTQIQILEFKESTLKREGMRCKNCEEYEQKLARSRQEFEALQDRYNSARATGLEAERNVQELREQIEEERKNIKEICGEMKSLENEKNKIESELRLKKSSFEKESGDIISLRTENASLKHRLNIALHSLEELERNKEELDKLKERLLTDEEKIMYSKEEKIGIQKENKKLKEDVQNLLIQLKESESRLQEYAAELEGIPSTKRRIENLQTDNAELEKRCRHKDGLLQNADSNAQKMKKDNQQLHTQMISQKQNYDTLNNKLESLKDKNLELEDRLRRRSPVVVADPKNCQNCWKYRNDISDLKREINDLRDRLSEAAGNKLRDNNPNIADLSDMNRPTSLAEKFSSLYTDEYTDAMEVIEDDMDEAASVKVMLQWLQSCYSWCQKLAKEQRDTLINKSIGFMQNHGGQNVVLSDRCLIFVKEFQKKIAVESLVVVGQICHVKSVTQQTLSSEDYIVKYIKKCSELCWMMQISDPPLYLNFGVNSGENLNKNDYNVFTKSGSKIDYLVWPVLYLHKTGPMLAKGVAQGK
ncbi:putative leucine-rich repeat-containing protein DDB_G0290503 isoform X2 [Mytilus californianus]|uniref:putative leucine-rich repeat-containing protein DDB_G0290503 isoform X2 n=1 Tax=Mytilus californianus TaxID=6549 RepID=UPI0022450FB8|nr:putative leucine-rich repeat-containing protein DDB_G0290503 isoform X2 [Mytilus californianus]